MNKKNIILGLSLILSSVATLNLTSCSDDDDDDANHAPKTVQVDSSKIAKDTAATTKLEKEVKGYVMGQLKGLTDNISVKETANELTITIVANQNNKKAVREKVYPMNAAGSELTKLIKKSIPNAVKTEFSHCTKNAVITYTIGYNK